MSYNDEQFLNALSPILVTVSGISIFSIPVHPANKYCAILLTPFSKETFFNSSQSEKGPSECAPLPSQNTCDFSRLFGISILVNPVKRNAALPNSTKLLGKCTGLLNVLLPDSIKKIDDEAFLECENLKIINLPKSLVEFGMDRVYLTQFNAGILEKRMEQKENTIHV